MLEGIVQNAPLLAIMLPLIAAPVAVLFGNKSVAFYISGATLVLSFALCVYMALLVSDGSILSYHIGGWAPPIGIEYRIDAANAMVMIIVSAMGALVLPYARASIEKEISPGHHTMFYACYMLCFTGLMGVAATGDAFNVFVFLEISSLSTYVLVAMGARQDKRALSAAYDYLILGTVGATFFVIGLGFLYIATGTLNMVDLADKLANSPDNKTIRAGFALIVIGMGLKLALFPLHRWLPGAYSYAPSAVSAFLASTATKVALYVVIRFTFSVYDASSGFERTTLEYIILPLAITAMFTASAVAIFQMNVKKLLAYSSVSQIGYMLLGLTYLNQTGVAASFIHMFNHAMTKGALFMAVGMVVWRTGSALLPSFAGIGRTMPWTAAAIVVAGLSLIGVPATAGFVSKWVLMAGAFERGWWPVSFAIVGSSVLAVIYVWRLVEVMYFQEPKATTKDPVREAPLAMLVPTWILILAIVWFGIAANAPVELARIAADGLLAGGFDNGQTVILGIPGR